MVTTGSILNTRMNFAPKTSGGGGGNGGVKTNSLQMTNIKLAARTGKPGTASYTSMSNQINGRAVVINVGNGETKCCKHGKTNFLGATLAALATPEGQMLMKAGVTGLQKLLKSGNDGSVKPNTNTTPTGNASLSSTLDSLVPDIDLTNIDYEASANDFMSQMKGAKNSQDLYQALQGAKAYRTQVNARMAQIKPNLQNMTTQLETLKGNAEGSIKEAKGALDDAKDGVGKANSEVKQGKTQVESARKGYESAKAQIKTDNAAYKEASGKVDTATKEYDAKGKALSEARTNYSNAKTVTQECTQALATAKTNTSQALANLNALKAQQKPGLGTDSAALQAQIADAQAQYDSAKAAEESAQKSLDNAKDSEAKAKEALGDDSKGAVQAFNNAKTALSEARNGLKAAAEQLKNDKEITQDQYDLLNDRMDSAQKAETNLETQQENLVKAKDAQSAAEQKLNELNAKKEELETQMHDYEEMQKASDKLSDLSQFETKLEQMMAKEKTDRQELQAKLDAKNAVSNDGSQTGKTKRKAEQQETKLTGKIANIDAGSALDDIARDKAMNIGNEAAMMSQTRTHTEGPLSNINNFASKATQQQEQRENEMKLKLLKTGVPQEFNGKMVMTGIADNYSVNGQNYTFEELQKAVKDGTL